MTFNLLHQAQRDLEIPEEGDPFQEDVRSQGSFKAEIHFLGQVVGGTLFDQGSEGLICEVQLQAGKHWKQFGPEISTQSQTSYADAGKPSA